MLKQVNKDFKIISHLSFTTKEWKVSDKVIILLHGLGADENDLVGCIEGLDLPEHIPVKFLLPSAPIRKVTINNGIKMRAWYDIFSVDFERKVDLLGVQDSCNQVTQLINKVIADGTQAKDIIVIGFSQGGAMAFEIAFNYPSLLGGVGLLSCYLVNQEKVVTCENKDFFKNIPIFWAHGYEDNVIPFQVAKKHCEILKHSSYSNILWKEYNIEHSISFEELEDLKKWIIKVFN